MTQRRRTVGRPARGRLVRLAGGLLAVAVLVATANGHVLSAASQTAADRYPGAHWDRASPADFGWSTARVDEATAWASRIGMTAAIAAQHGVIVVSWGAVSEKLELHSIRKSLLNALLGIAIARRRIDLRETLADLGIDDTPPPLTPEERTATVLDLLEARSGVYHPALYETAGMAAARPPRGSHAPGTFWYYNNWDFNVLGTVYERAAGRSVFTAFAEAIAAPIGMEAYRPADGGYVTGAASRYPAYPFRMTARDLARFALLYLRRGRWGGRQIVPAAWVDASTTAHSLAGSGLGYGYLWWTGLPHRGAPVVGLPDGGFFAWGALGQFALVVPSDDLIVVSLKRARPAVTLRQMGHFLWLILQAAHAPDAGADPLSSSAR